MKYYTEKKMNQELKEKANNAIKLKLKFMMLIGMKRKVRDYILYNGLGKDFLNWKLYSKV